MHRRAFSAFCLIARWLTFEASQIMNGRFFAGRRVAAFVHDGVKYRKSVGADEEGGTDRATWGKYLGAEPAAAAAPGTTDASNGVAT